MAGYRTEFERYLDEAGITPQQAHRETGLSLSTIYKLISGERRPSRRLEEPLTDWLSKRTGNAVTPAALWPVEPIKLGGIPQIAVRQGGEDSEG